MSILRQIYRAIKTYPNFPAPNFFPSSKSAIEIEGSSTTCSIFEEDFGFFEKDATVAVDSVAFDLLRKTIEKMSLFDSIDGGNYS